MSDEHLIRRRREGGTDFVGEARLKQRAEACGCWLGIDCDGKTEKYAKPLKQVEKLDKNERD